MDLNIRPMTQAERNYCYSWSSHLMAAAGCIGHLRGDMGREGNGFYTTWFDHQEDLKTRDFKTELDAVVNALRFDPAYDGALSSRSKLASYCRAHPDGRITPDGNAYGFRLDTENYAYMLRLCSDWGDYNVYIYGYVRERLDGHMAEAGRGIRFVTPGYRDLFRLENQDGYPVNAYFNDHPEMVLGCPGVESTRYGHDYTVYPSPGADLARQLHEAAARVCGQYRVPEVAELEAEEAAGEAIPADPSVKNYSYAVVDGAIYYRENSVMVKSKLNATAKARVKGMVQLRDCVRQLIDLQLDENVPDSALRPKQDELNRLYDAYTRKYGLINGRGNRLAFDKDS